MPPTSRAESPSLVEAAASANGKLAPHSSVGGKIAQRQRARSTWKVNHGLVESSGLIGQKGSEEPSMMAVQAMPSTSRSWQQPRAKRGFTERAIIAPAA